MVAPERERSVLFVADAMQFEQARQCIFLGRQLIAGKSAEGFEIVTGDACEHMMFDMVFHMPEKEGAEGIEFGIATADTEVGMIGFASGVLVDTAKIDMEIRSVEWCKGNQQCDEPISGRDAGRHKDQMADEQENTEPPNLPPLRIRRLSQNELFPQIELIAPPSPAHGRGLKGEQTPDVPQECDRMDTINEQL